MIGITIGIIAVVILFVLYLPYYEEPLWRLGGLALVIIMIIYIPWLWAFAVFLLISALVANYKE
ncbi:hypothetical protein B6S12_00280 [Helicobacter valdiviensis]|uniref:Uncharacterized protein n=1 Tax=Helicobacter valdiviensis TaxID=1458358 RepID=A0A2W6NNN7_9HELI|nr:hypothetical protein [Helicobacter valdiviensis]PZT49066.1 hypothetical protein B6S12_00280 [Helicobacter valdiviensis]